LVGTDRLHTNSAQDPCKRVKLFYIDNPLPRDASKGKEPEHQEIGLTQGRIAQIESGVGTTKVTFDILLSILVKMGFDFKILPKKSAANYCKSPNFNRKIEKGTWPTPKE
jgi:hypothetical protein